MSDNNISELEKLNSILDDELNAEYVDEEKTVVRINNNPRKEYERKDNNWHHSSDRKSWVFESIKELGEHINYKNK